MTLKQSKHSVVNLIKPHAGKWVALNEKQDKVVCVASSAKAVLVQAHKKGESFPHLVKAPDSSTAVFVY